VFRRKRFFQGRPIHGEDVADIEWYALDGSKMSEERWSERMVRSIGLLLNGDLPDRDERGAPVRDDTFYALLHADPEPADACIPGDPGTTWRIVFDTAHGVPFDQGDHVPAGAAIPIEGRSVMVLRREPPP
jgi:glycogen operon protein